MLLDFKVSRVYKQAWRAKKKIQIHRGGTRSSKTFSISQIVIMWLFTGVYEEGGTKMDSGLCTVLRKYSATLVQSVIRDFESMLFQYGVYDTVKINKAEHLYQYQGRIVEFRGADDPQKLRSATRDLLWCAEANELASEDFFQAMIRTRNKIWIDFNPDDENVWINTELEQIRQKEKGDVDVIVSTYKDNPFLSKEIVEEIEYLEKVDPALWQIYGRGEYGKLEGLIYHWNVCAGVPSDAAFIAYGLDFGFSNHPSALVQVFRRENEIYVEEKLYRTNMTNQDLGDAFKIMGVPYSAEIFADCAEPKSIEELKRMGFNIKPVDKGKDSILFGIDILRSKALFIPERCTSLLKEIKGYKWKIDKNGTTLNEPIKINDHGMDAMRYVGMMKFESPWKSNESILKMQRSLLESRNRDILSVAGYDGI